MLANPAGYLTGHCGATYPESHTACRGAVARGSESNDLGEIACVCLCHTDQREEFLAQLFDLVCWRTRDPDTGEIKKWRTEAEARDYARANDEARAHDFIAADEGLDLCEECGAVEADAVHHWEPPLDDEEKALLAAAADG